MYTLRSNLHMVEGEIDSHWTEGFHYIRNEINAANDDCREIKLMDRVQIIGLGGLVVSATRMTFTPSDLTRVENVGERIDLTLGRGSFRIVPHESVLAAAQEHNEYLHGQLVDTFAFPNLNDSWLIPTDAIEVQA